MFEYDFHADHPRLKKYFRDIESAKEPAAKSIIMNSTFTALLKYFGTQAKWKLIEKYPLITNDAIYYTSGIFVDRFDIIQGIWIILTLETEAEKTIARMIKQGVPVRNTLFQSDDRLIIWRKGKKAIDTRFQSAEEAVSVFKVFFKSPISNYKNLEDLYDRILEEGPGLLETWVESVRREYNQNSRFKTAFDAFESKHNYLLRLDPQQHSLPEIIIRYLLLRRLSDKIFKRSAFITSTPISQEIERVIATSSTIRVTPDLIREMEPIIRHLASDLIGNDEKLIFLTSLLGCLFPRP